MKNNKSKNYPASKSIKKKENEMDNLYYKKNQATINYKGFTLNLDIPEIINVFKGKE